MENKILSSCFQSKESYDEICPYVKEEDFSGVPKIVWGEIAEFYLNDPNADSCDRDIILARIERESPKALDLSKALLYSFDEEVSAPNIKKEIIEFRKYRTSLELSQALISGNSVAARGLIEQWEEYDSGELEDEDDTSEVYTSVPVSEVVQGHTADNLIKVYPNALNELLEGGVQRGTCMALYARPEVGKSLVSINMAAGFCRDGHRTLYIGNEDPAPTMLLRFITRMSGMDKFSAIESPEEAEEKAKSKGYDNLIFASLSPGTPREIEELIIKYQPDCVVVDQVRNLDVKAEGLVQILEIASRRLRTLGKKYNCVMVQVTQAGDSATDKLVLAMNDVDNSKTGFQASFDVMVGIGCNEQFEVEGRRMLSITKNKVSASHTFFPINVDKTLTKVGSI